MVSIKVRMDELLFTLDLGNEFIYCGSQLFSMDGAKARVSIPEASIISHKLFWPGAHK